MSDNGMMAKVSWAIVGIAVGAVLSVLVGIAWVFSALGGPGGFIK